MKSTELHIMMKQLINNQGASFIADKRFANILLDMGCFGSYPKCKNVLKTINENDYANRILSYMDGYEPKDEIFNTMFDELSTQYNYAKNDISYCIQSILYGLNILDGIEKYSSKLDYGWLNQLEEYCNITQEEVDAWNTEYCILNITPTDADVFVDGRRIKHDDEPIVLELACGEHKIKASSPMYYNHEDSFMVSDEQDNSLSIELKPQFGSILVMTNAKDAMVYIDDVEIGIAPISMEKLASGTHSLRIEDALHKKFEEVFVMSDGQRLEKDITMESNFGEVVLCTDDKELQVYIDGQYQGVGSWKGQLPVGHHSIECKKESHFSKTLNVFVKLGDESINTFTLPILEAYYGCLKVNVKPVGSIIYLDDKIIGKSPLIYRQALVGNHKLIVHNKLCDKRIVKDISIEEGLITIIEDTLSQTFFSDYRKIQVGDYFYDDGTFSHNRSFKKKAVGIVFTLQTSEEEKNLGWRHGKIISLNSSHRMEWSDDYKFINEEIYSYIPKTSGWYLPTVEQWTDVFKFFTTELSKQNNSKTKSTSIIDVLHIHTFDDFWTRTLSVDAKHAYIIRYNGKFTVDTCKIINKGLIRGIAAF